VEARVRVLVKLGFHKFSYILRKPFLFTELRSSGGRSIWKEGAAVF